MRTSIREYQPDDFDALWRLDQECFAPGIAYSRFELMYYIRRPGTFTLVSEDGNAGISGFTVAEYRTARSRASGQEPVTTGHIITIDVQAKLRRSGVGTMLMDAVENRLRGVGCGAVYLETAVNNANAISFYKRRGYNVLSTIPRYYDGTLDALVMGKKLISAQRSHG